jgi:hypothetical protein
MLDEIDSFVEPVVAEACDLLQLTAPETYAKVTTDSRVILCARAAYTQISNYLNRDLIYKQHYEEYFEEDTTITLRCVPVSEITLVSISDTRYSDVLTDPDAFTVLDPDEDYRLVREKRLVIYNLTNLAEIVGSTTQKINAYVEYVGGYYSTEDIPVVHNALVTQTIANYNRVPSLGLTQIEGGGGDAKGGRLLMNLNLVDAGQLLDSVKIMLDPFVYYGSAEDLT